MAELGDRPTQADLTQPFMVEGHTDSKGSEEFNQGALRAPRRDGRRRARAPLPQHRRPPRPDRLRRDPPDRPERHRRRRQPRPAAPRTAASSCASRPRRRPRPAGSPRAQAAIVPEPAITVSSSSTRIGTERWPLRRSTSARSRAREGQVQGMPVPPLTVPVLVGVAGVVERLRRAPARVGDRARQAAEGRAHEAGVEDHRARTRAAARSRRPGSRPSPGGC